MKSTFFYTIDVDDSSSSTLLSRQILDSNVDRITSSADSHQTLLLHVLATYRLLPTCPSSQEIENPHHYLLTLNYKRYGASVMDSTVVTGTIFLDSNDCSSYHDFNATSILIFETTYLNFRSPTCLYFNQGGKISFPIRKATGLFSKYQSGRVEIDYYHPRRTLEILSLD